MAQVEDYFIVDFEQQPQLLEQKNHPEPFLKGYDRKAFMSIVR